MQFKEQRRSASLRQRIVLGCVQTDATLLSNNSQHCWMLHSRHQFSARQVELWWNVNDTIVGLPTEVVAIKKGESHATTMSWIRVRVSFALLRSALLCFRGFKSFQESFWNCQTLTQILKNETQIFVNKASRTLFYFLLFLVIIVFFFKSKCFFLN